MMPGRIGHHLPHMPGRFNQAQSQWISTQFDRLDQAGIQCNLNGFPPYSTTQFIEMMPGQIGQIGWLNWVEIH